MAESTSSPKQVLAIVGSGHRRGATYTAAEKLLKDLEAFGDVQGEIVVLSDYDIGICRGCKTCFLYGEDRCPLKDDRDLLLGKMMEADGVVLASPNYSWQVSSLMKVFLDRIGFALHRPCFHGKAATAVVVYGIALGSRVRKYLEFVEGGLGFNVVKGTAMRTLEPMTEEALRKMDESLARQAQRFHAQLMRPAYPSPSLFKLMIFRMGRSGIRVNAPQDKRDWAYYRDMGWFESDYYYPVHLGLIKRGLGALFDWAGANVSAFKVAEPEAERASAPSSGATAR